MTAAKPAHTTDSNLYKPVVDTNSLERVRTYKNMVTSYYAIHADVGKCPRRWQSLGAFERKNTSNNIWAKAETRTVQYPLYGRNL
jgi:hypothetical protein